MLPRRTVQQRLDVVRTALSCLQLDSVPYRVITIAGTNGKGSCVALLEAIYCAAGYRVGCLSSPHLLHFRERIRIQGKPVSTDAIRKAFLCIKQCCGDLHLGYFQKAFLAALMIFHPASLDIAILEVGVGGRYDCVNLIDPDISMITTVALDHIALLGDTREAIAEQKAGVMRSGVVTVCGDRNPPPILQTIAEAQQAVLYTMRDFRYIVEAELGKWNWEGCNQSFHDLPIPSILLQNASATLCVVEAFQSVCSCSETAIRAGLQSVQLAGRIQLLHSEKGPILLDVSHNPEGVKALREAVDQQKIAGRIRAIVGIKHNKDILGMLQNMVDCVDEWLVIPLSPADGSGPELIYGALKQLSSGGRQCYPDARSAFASACEHFCCEDLLVVFGSFFTVSAVMRILMERSLL